MHKHPTENNPREGGKPQKHVSDAELLSYLEGSLEENESRAIQQHLNSCPQCFGLVASVHRESLSLENETEIKNITANANIHFETQLQKLIDKGWVKPEAPPPSFWVILLGTLQTLRRQTRPYYVTAGSLVAVALLTFFVALPQIFAWQSSKLAKKSLTAMVTNCPITDRKTPRPSGGFQFRSFGKTRGSEQNIADNTVANLKRALELNKNNVNASEYLGTFYLIETRDYQKAREAYATAFFKDSTNAAIMNDQGVLAMYESKYEEAYMKFSRALKYDSTYAEAQYNLALLLQQQGHKQGAVRAWEKYLMLDNPKSKWAIIAEDNIEELRQN